jgi:protease I
MTNVDTDAPQVSESTDGRERPGTSDGETTTSPANDNLQQAVSAFKDLFRRRGMRPRPLQGLRVAVLAADGFEQVELTVPMRRLRHEGAEVTLVSLHPGRIRGMNFIWPGRSVKVDAPIERVRPTDFDALYIPGGFVNPDLLRQSPRVLELVKEMAGQGKPIASLCHGPWVLISAGLVRGRRLTSWPGIADDVVSAGGTWTDEPVVVDERLVTSRSPADLPRFDDAVVELFAGTLARAPEVVTAVRARPSDRLLENTVAAAAALTAVRTLRGIQA